LHQIGLYSDISWLYDRDRLWLHPLPYINYALEYPVGIGGLSWVLSFAPGGHIGYYLATIALLVLAGLATIWLVQAMAGSNPWLLASTPALLLYTALNWDIVAIFFLVAALVALSRDRAGWGGVSLAVAALTKFFPLIAVPVVIIWYWRGHRWRELWRFSAAFGTISFLLNGPFAIQYSAGRWHLRDAWLYFFKFNQARVSEGSLWNALAQSGLRLSTTAINQASALLLLVGLAVVVLAIWRAGNRVAPATLLALATLGLLSWWFAINKVYSPQYALWLFALLALCGAPVWLGVTFALADLVYFVAVLTVVAQQGWVGWMNAPLLHVPILAREVVMLVLAGWAVVQLIAPGRHTLPAENATNG
ncbi:MAG: glycosyltransferase 87 family protein, partial [Thermomicrobiales bacterium]